MKSWRWRRRKESFSRTMTSSTPQKRPKSGLKTNNIQVLSWPVQFPDISPIEHLWVHLKKKLNKYPIPPKGVHELWKRVAEVWDEITPRNMPESYRKHAKKDPGSYQSKRRSYQVLIVIVIEGQKTIPMIDHSV